MGKPTGKKKKKKDAVTPRAANTNGKPSKPFDEDTAIFINMSQELREEGNKLLQKKDHEGAMLKYEKALKLLPNNHIDVAHLRINMATCYMQLGLGEYPRAINQCNLALQVSPKYSKALLKRANCYGALNRFDLAIRDVHLILAVEPNNVSALEFLESLKMTMEEKGIAVDDEKVIAFDNVQHPPASAPRLQKNVVREKVKKKRGKKSEDKVVVEEHVSAVKDEEIVSNEIEQEKRVVGPVKEEKAVTRTVKLGFGEDIRWAQLPGNCSLKLVRDIFPGLKGVLVKYRDQDGDLVTITTTDELRRAESSGSKLGSMRLYITEVSPDQEPSYDGITNEGEVLTDGIENGGMEEGKDGVNRMTTVEDWLIQFARLFKNHVGFESDSYLDIHELAMKLYTKAMGDTVKGDDAQELFEIAADKFQEMPALALFNWGVFKCPGQGNKVSFQRVGLENFHLSILKLVMSGHKRST